MRNSTRLTAKSLNFRTGQLSVQNFNSRIRAEVNMLAQIYVGKTAFSQVCAQ